MNSGGRTVTFNQPQGVLFFREGAILNGSMELVDLLLFWLFFNSPSNICLHYKLYVLYYKSEGMSKNCTVCLSLGKWAIRLQICYFFWTVCFGHYHPSNIPLNKEELLLLTNLRECFFREGAILNGSMELVDLLLFWTFL